MVVPIAPNALIVFCHLMSVQMEDNVTLKMGNVPIALLVLGAIAVVFPVSSAFQINNNSKLSGSNLNILFALLFSLSIPSQSQQTSFAALRGFLSLR